MNMRFGTWNVRSLYRAGSPTTLAKGISECELDLVGVQDGSEVAPNQQANIQFSTEKGMAIMI
jgi:hypothetical protein